METFRKEVTNLDLDGEFLGNLADKAFFGSFTRLDFAAGEFPPVSESAARPSFGDKNSIVVDKNGRRYFYYDYYPRSLIR